ncbi:hypothetical protein J4710_08870 [Staphylococcus xylosus]|uniref:Uncharacterized protein n=1 Tax=Staphylococcus xylosus TaxID=1288 RepID=A0A939NLY4_STAXY|nr:hypothetical protein [Staphylococcus xylosus]
MPPGGAQQIMASGALNDLDEVYGIHVVPVAGPEVIGYNTGNVCWKLNVHINN